MILVFIAGALAGLLIFTLTIVRQMLFIGKPNEILVISGKSSTLEDGSQVGYSRVLRGGRAFRIPIIHQIESMSLTTSPIDIQVKTA
jgi:flotillin